MIELLNSTVANNIATVLIHSFWQAGLIFFLVKVARLFSAKANAEFRYGLAVGAMAIFFIVNGLTYGLLTYSSVAATPEVLSTLGNLSLTQLSSLTNQANSALFESSAYVPYFILFWWLGLVLFTLRFTLSLYKTHRISTSGLIDPPQELSKLLQSIKKRLEVSPKVSLYLSEKVFSPMVVGVLKPVVLLPVGLLNGLSTQEVEAILIHELNHIRRHDYLVNILQSMIEVLYFFNPFVWLISAEIREQRENACDDKALAHGISRRSYAEMLANIYEFAYYQNNMAISFAERKKLTLKRIRRIMKTPSNNNKLFSSLVIVSAISMAIYVGAEAPVAAEHLPFYTPERVVEANPLGSFRTENTAELIKTLKISLENRSKPELLTVAADTIDEKELAKKALEYEKAMERLEATKEWQELETLRKDMIEEQMKLMKELKPQIEEAMKAVDLDIKLDEVELAALREQMADLKIQMDDLALTEEMTRAMEQSARVVEESMAQIEAEMALVKADELKEMAMKFAAEALESAADAEVMAKEAEKVAAEAMKVAKKVEVFMTELKKELVEDGYLKAKDDLTDLKFEDGKVFVNKREVKTKDAKKYYQLRKEHLGEDADFFMNKN